MMSVGPVTAVRRTLRRIHVIRAVTVSVCILCGGAARGAGRSPDGSLADLGLEELMQIPVYAASGYVQSAAEAPSRVSVITRDDIRAYGYRTLAEALAGQAGFFSSYDRQYHYLGVRGFGPPGDYNTRVLILLDGQRVNDELYGNGGVGTDFILDLSLVERIEIVRGPASSLYGSNAFLGVVNVITRRGTDLGGAEVEGFAASHGTWSGRLSYGRAVGRDAEILVSGTIARSAGQDLFFEEFDAPETNDGRAEGLDGEHGGSLFLSARRGEFALLAAFADRTRDVPTAPWEVMFNTPGLVVQDRRLQAGLSWERELGRTGRVTALLSYQDYRYRGSYPYDWAEEGEDTRIVMNRDYARASWWGAEVRLVSEALARNKIHAGLEYRDSFRLEQDNDDDGAPAPNLRSHKDASAWGAYLQDEVRLADRALLSAGLRFDRTEPRGETRFSPRLGLILTPASTTTLKLLYGEAFRSPNAFERYYEDGGVSQKPSPGLDAETIRSYEAVLEQRLGERVRASLSAFHWVIDGLIRQAEDPADGLLEFRNVERAVADGVEAELHLLLPGGAGATAAYSYTDAEDADSGEDLVNSPRHQASLRALVPLAGGRARAAAEARYLGERGTRSGEATDAAVVVNLTLTAPTGGGRWEASAGVLNLFDAAYAQPVGDDHVQDAIPQDGRTFRLGLTGRF